MAKLPETSLIICSRNRPDLLFQAVQSVLAGNEVPTEFIIVDQSDDPNPSFSSLATDRPCAIRYVWTPSMGVSRARNAAIDSARYEVLVLTDDDVEAAPNWLGTLVHALQDERGTGVVTGQVAEGPRDMSAGFAPSVKQDSMPAVYKGRVAQDVLYGLNMAMYRCVVDEVGGFDTRLGPGTRFPAAEDSDLGFRLLEAGYRIIYVPQAVVYHHAWRNERQYLSVRWKYGVGRGAFYVKHLSFHDRYMLSRLIADVRRHLVQSLCHVRREPYLAQSDMLLALGILYGSLKWLLTRPK